MRKVSILTFVLAALLFYNNCSGFSAREFEALSSSSSGAGGAQPIVPSPAPTPLPSGKTKMFIAQGRLGRTVISCDDGQTWIHDQSVDDTKRCWLADQSDPRNVECDHNPYAGVGMDSGDGYIFANYGWGFAGSLKRSADAGVTWQTLRSDSWGGGVAYAQGRVLLGWNGWYVSDDAGATWANAPSRPPDAVIADHAHVHRLGSKFAIVANSGIALSSDKGQTWTSTLWNFGWSPISIAEGNGVLVTIGSINQTDPSPNLLHLARSIDGGKTWTDSLVTSGLYLGWLDVIFNGTDFVAWTTGAQMWKSHDGVTWTSTPITTTGTYTGGAAWIALGAIAYNSATGTYVTIQTQWGQWYDKQKAYRSTDGINWVELDAAHYTGGHPIGMIMTADVDKSLCH